MTKTKAVHGPPADKALKARPVCRCGGDLVRRGTVVLAPEQVFELWECQRCRAETRGALAK